MPAPALELRQVVRRHPGAARPAVDALSLAVAPGELLALLGPSGAGKSTTLRVVAGYDRPDAGTVWLDGRDVTALPPEHRGIGMVFQHHALFPHLSVAENVAFGLRARRVPAPEREARVARALAGVGLDGAGPRAVQRLSGGEQQRVALARALVLAPRVLLLDEPLSNLDPARRVAMRDELRALLHREGVAALLVTHDQDDALAVADRVALLDAGRLLQVGPPAALYDAPASRAVAAFVGRAALLPAAVDDGCVVVRIGQVAQRARLRGTRPEGPALAVLRPEALALAPAGAPDAWPGTVEARRFAGAATLYRVALADGGAVEVQGDAGGPAEGARVGVRLVAASLALVASQAASRAAGLG